MSHHRFPTICGMLPWVVWSTCVLPGCRPGPEPKETVAQVSPVVQRSDYAGHQVCAECHAEIAESHALSGHSRTFALTRDSSVAAKLCGLTSQLPDPYGRYEYSCDAEGVMVAIPARFQNRAFPLEYALGSGDHATTFFSLMPDASGEVAGIEHRLSWYRSDESFDTTPGQEDLVPMLDAEYFGRVIEPDDARRCIGCHTTFVRFAGAQLHDLYPGVQCESCHGPGARHVQAARSGDSAAALSGIRRSQNAAEELELCGRCHRRIEEIAEERLQRYPPSLIRFQPVGLVQSRCYLETPGGTRCTHCHDPHSPVSSRTQETQIQTCLGCHGKEGQTECRVSAAGNCIECHMPLMDLVRGISFHDHWIRVRRGDAGGTDRPGDSDHTTLKRDR